MISIAHLKRLVIGLQEAGYQAELLVNDYPVWDVYSDECVIRITVPEGQISQDYSTGQFCLTSPEDTANKDPLVLMGDLGVTWEPPKVHQTPCIGRIAGEVVEWDLVVLLALADHYFYPEATE